MGFDFLCYDLKHSDKSVETFSKLARTNRVGDVDILARNNKSDLLTTNNWIQPLNVAVN